MNQNSSIKIISIAIAASVVLSSLVTIAVVNYQASKKPTNNKLIEEFYLVENAVHVSPHGLRGKIDKGDESYVLVDVRSPEEYEKGHIIGAVNVAAYKDPYTPAYEEKDRIIGEFRELTQNNPDKDIIVYCYSTPCMTGKKVGKMLTEKGIYVKQLGIGWNEWRYHWRTWNHEHEWKTTKPEDYIWRGKEPGVPKIREIASPCGVGELGC